MTQNNQLKPLIYLKQGDKFIYNGIIHTVYAHESGMTEVFRNNEWKCWNNRHSKGLVMVQPFITII